MEMTKRSIEIMFCKLHIEIFLGERAEVILL